MNITNRTTHNVHQGSESWLALRAKYLTASEAPAALGVSRYQSRSDLIRQKATGITVEHDEFTLKRFAEGHRAEAAARPLAEAELGDDLSPVTMTAEVDGVPLLASLDGLDFDGSTAWECKLWNEDLAAQVRTNNLAAQYTVQMDQQQLVSGAKRTLFTCSDGTPERTVHCWYESNDDKKAILISSAKQLHQDVAAYAPTADAAPEVVGQAPDHLPALRIDVTGMVTASNLDDFKAVALRTISAIRTELVTDQDFADAEKTVKWCGEVEVSLAAAKQHALSQTESIDRLFRAIDEISASTRAVRLKLEKMVKSEKEARKEQIVMHAQQSLDAHIAELNRQLGAPLLQRVLGAFALAIKGLKSLDRMQDMARAELVLQKFHANTLADRLKENREYIGQAGADWMHLFPDFATIGTKAAEDFQALALLRIGKHKEAEAARAEAQREQIRQEEAAKLRREAEALESAKNQASDEAHAKQQAAQAIQTAVAQPAQRARMDADQRLEATVAGAPATRAPDAQQDDGQATLKLGDINARLKHISVTADGLRHLGFEPAARDKRATLYTERQFSRICDAIAQCAQEAQRSTLATA